MLHFRQVNYYMNHNFQARVPKQRNIGGNRQNSTSSRYSTATEQVYSQHGFTDDTFDEDIDELGLALGKDVGKILDSQNANQNDLDALMNIESFRASNNNGLPNGLNTTSTSLYADGGSHVTTTTQPQNSAKSIVDSLLSDPSFYLDSSSLNIIPTIQNIVATVSVGCVLDLQALSLKLRNAEYNPKRFSAIIMRIREPRATALVFQSGKIVVTGTKQEADCRYAARKFCKLIRSGGYSQVRFLDFTIQNIVSSADVRFPIKLEKLCNDNFGTASYEPELFPGLIYRMLKPKVALLVFVSGKVIITGAKTRKEMIAAFEDLYPL